MWMHNSPGILVLSVEVKCHLRSTEVKVGKVHTIAPKLM